MLEFITRVGPTAMPRGDAPNVHHTQPWYDLWPGKPKPGPCQQPGAALSHRNRFTPPPRTANIYTASHAADEIGVDQAQVHAQALSKSRTDLLAQSRKSLPRGSDNVTDYMRRCARSQAAAACGKGGAEQAGRTCRAPHRLRRSPTRSRPLRCMPSRQPRAFERKLEISAVK